MRARSLIVPSLLLVLAGCTEGARIEKPAGAPALPDVVVLDTGEESLVVESDSGTVLASDAGEVTAPDGSRLYSSETGGGATRLDTRDSVSGALLSTRSLVGALDVRVASVTGRAVAMMRPRPDGADPAIALPRSHTTIVVADPTGAEAPARYRLEGNFEPEAFSVDDARLFLIQYLPPEAPSVYRVTFLDLASSKVRSVFGRFKTPAQRMPGVRLEQVFDPTSDQLYTLYSNRPSKDLQGYWSESPAYGDRAVTFVHVLNLRGGWAYCAGLPKSLWGEPAGAQAMAPSPDGRSLFVVDSMRGLIAELDTETMEVVRTGRVDLGSLEDGRTSATMSADGKTLYVASARDGDAVYAIDAGTLEVRTRWTVAGDVRGLALSVDGARLYAALGDRVTILDSSSGAELAALPFLGVERILHVATRAA